MRYLKQTKGKFNGKVGNCQAVAIACFLDLDIDDVPNCEVLFNNKSKEALHAIVKYHWLQDRGLVEDEQAIKDLFLKHVGRIPFEDNEKELIYFVVGDSPRGVKHVVLCQNGKMIHDPYPTGEGLVRENYAYMIVPIKNEEDEAA